MQQPIELQQEIITHLYDSLPLCILLANKNLKPWFYNHFTSLYIEYTQDINGYSHHDIRYAENGIYIDYCSFKDVLTYNPVYGENVYLHSDIIDFLKENIKAGNYTIVFSDQYELPQTMYFHSYHLDHEVLVYGYDDEKQCLNCVMFDENSKFTSVDVPYDDFKRAYKALYSNLAEHDADFWVYLKYIYLIKPLPFQYEFSLPEFIHEIQKYCYGNMDAYRCMNLRLVERNKTVVREVDGIEQDVVEQWKYHFGVDIYDELCNILENNRLRYGCERLNFLEYHILYEHAIQMCKRLQYVSSNVLKSTELNNTICRYEQVVKKSEQLRMMAMKYNRLYDMGVIDNENAKTYIDNIKKLLHEIGEEEKATLLEVCNMCEKFDC